MKQGYCILLCACLYLLLGGCTDFTEINPKGKSVLDKVEDLDLVLNYSYTLNIDDVTSLVNDQLPYMENVPNLVNETTSTLEGILFRYDESEDRAALTDADVKYTELYGVIGKVANAVLANVDDASGDRTKALQLKAEALILRAWCHYLLVNLYAKAYDPATADTDPGIIYALENDLSDVPNEKLTVGKVYELILSDIDSALSLGSLPTTPADMRVGLPFAYAVKAKVLMSTRDYEGAFTAASESLSLKNTIDDYNDKIAISSIMQVYYGATVNEFSRHYLTCEEELFETPSMWIMQSFTPQFMEDIEENHIFNEEHLMYDTYVAELTPMVQPIYGATYYGITGYPVPMAMDVYFSPMGLTTVDMYLTQAECYLREGSLTEAMDLLNAIREKRLIRGTYEPVSAETQAEAFQWLKRVSRMENFYTLKNFINLKRWNTEEAYQETIRRHIEWTTIEDDGTGNMVSKTQEFTAELRPDSPLWIFPFPQNATNFNANLSQNYETGN